MSLRIASLAAVALLVTLSAPALASPFGHGPAIRRIRAGSSSLNVSTAADTSAASATASSGQFCYSKCPSGSSLFETMLTPGGSIVSPSNRFSLTLQNNGDVVILSNFASEICQIWSTGTSNKPTATFRMQADGNLVAYDKNITPLWASGTYLQGQGPYCLTMQDDGYANIYDSTCRSTWYSWTLFNNCPVNKLTYHNGDVMSNTRNGVNIYPVFYGSGFPTICDNNNQNCTSSDKLSMFFLGNIIYYPWFNTLLQYTGLNNDYIHARTNVADALYVSDSSTLSDIPDGFIQQYLANTVIPHFNGGNPDPNGIYLFMTGQSVKSMSDSGADFTNALGWHYRTTINNVNSRYMVVNQADPITVLAHELAETLTDPLGPNWELTYNADNAPSGEIGDLCQNYETYVTSFPGSPYFPMRIQNLLSNQDNYRCVSQPAHVARTCTSKCPAGSSLYQNQYILPGQSVTSPNGTYSFTLQTNGDFLAYKSTPSRKYCVIASAGTGNRNPASLGVLADGNFQVYFYDHAPWTSYTQYNGEGPYCLTMQDDSNIVLYDANCKAIWWRSNFPDLQGC